MKEIYFTLRISRNDYLRYYRGSARHVIVKANDGRHIQFPANILRPFVTREGIAGNFVLRLDENNKLINIEKR